MEYFNTNSFNFRITKLLDLQISLAVLKLGFSCYIIIFQHPATRRVCEEIVRVRVYVCAVCADEF